MAAVEGAERPPEKSLQLQLVVPAQGQCRVELLFSDGHLTDVFDHQRRPVSAVRCSEISPAPTAD